MAEDRLCVIDGDVIAYRVAFSMQKKSVIAPPSEGRACQKVDRMVWDIVKSTLSTSKVIYLTGKGNYRNDIATISPYKGNRKESAKPEMLGACRERLISNHFAQVTTGMEADDMMGIIQTKYNREFGWSQGKSIIASIDKDLRTIPGLHYNITRGETDTVDPKAALKFFYTQMLTGDNVDSIYSIHGMGAAKAHKVLKDATNPGEMFLAVAKAFHAEVLKEKSKSIFVMRGMSAMEAMKEIGDLVWILRDKSRLYSETVMHKHMKSIDVNLDFMQEKPK